MYIPFSSNISTKFDFLFDWGCKTQSFSFITVLSTFISLFFRGIITNSKVNKAPFFIYFVVAFILVTIFIIKAWRCMPN